MRTDDGGEAGGLHAGIEQFSCACGGMVGGRFVKQTGIAVEFVHGIDKGIFRSLCFGKFYVLEVAWCESVSGDGEVYAS